MSQPVVILLGGDYIWPVCFIWHASQCWGQVGWMGSVSEWVGDDGVIYYVLSCFFGWG